MDYSFSTVTDADKSSIKIQHETKEVEDLNLRIGIYEVEITLKDRDVLGDDVNVASRIDPFSAVGGILISGKGTAENIKSSRFLDNLGSEAAAKFLSYPIPKAIVEEWERVGSNK